MDWAGEIGHTLVPGSGGKKFEQLIGREVLIRQYREATGRTNADIQELLVDVRDRVPDAINIAEAWSKHLAYALLQACRLIDPDRIVLWRIGRFALPDGGCARRGPHVGGADHSLSDTRDRRRR
jgi:predicted NBD/HSP70 family sugar kinase